MGNTTSAGKEQMDMMLKALLKFLKETSEKFEKEHDASRQYAFATKIDKWIESGGQIIGYAITDNNIREMTKKELVNDDIAFIEMQLGNETILVIRDCDEKGLEVAKQAVQTVIGNYYQEIDRVEMADMFEKYSEFDNKPMEKQFLEFEDLDKDFAEIFKNKCNDVTRGFMIGSEIEKDKETITVQAKRTLELENKGNGSTYSRDVCHAFMAATLAHGGPNHDKNILQIEADKKTELEIMQYKGSEPKYVVGQNNPNVCLCITNEGYKIGRLNQETKEYEFGEINSKHTHDYEKELRMQLDGIFDICIEDDFTKVAKFAKGELDLESVRPQKTFKENQVSKAETIAADKIDAVIKRSFLKEYDEINKCTSTEKMQKYQDRMTDVFNALETGNIPNWLSKEEFDKLKQDLAKIDFKIENYRDGIDAILENQKISERSAAQILKEEKEKERKRQERNKEKEREM